MFVRRFTLIIYRCNVFCKVYVPVSKQICEKVSNVRVFEWKIFIMAIKLQNYLIFTIFINIM